jgi:dual specificity phosphatase 3
MTHESPVLDLSPAALHRALCEVDSWLVLSGDLHPDRELAQQQVAEYRQMGITHIIDCREEWDDEELLAELAPEIRYWNLGTHDDGGFQPDTWFDAGVAAYRQAMANGEAKILVHCHMGVNRGPSMALRLMLEHDPEALPEDCVIAIRRARPIARIHYAEDAARHHLGPAIPENLEGSRKVARMLTVLADDMEGMGDVIHAIRRSEGS